MRPGTKVFIALDNMAAIEAMAMIDLLAPQGVGFKVGLELICSGDADAVITYIRRAHRGRVLFDIKLNDIPNTMAQAARRIAAKEGVVAFTCHASASVAGMLAASVERKTTHMYAVTVLTSMDGEADAQHVFGAPAKSKVVEFARDAILGGASGIVCSPVELVMLNRQPELRGLLYITPGVRPDWADAGDQKRIMTPGEAIWAGADYLVIGRPVTRPPPGIGGPEQALMLVLKEVEAAFKEVRRARK